MRIATFLKLLPKVLNLKNLGHHSFGFCPVCQHSSLFLATDKPELIRNHALCIRCASVSRHRAIALCVLNQFRDSGIQRLSDFANRPDIRILNTNTISPIFKKLGKVQHIFHSEYFDEIKSGQYKDGVLCQNLEALSFEDGSLDLIITEDVFEHVKEVERGFEEVHRVLKKGGCHVFSIPFFFSKMTRHLFEKRGEEYHPVHFPVEYHGDGVRGQIPAYHYLGYDMFELWDRLGFNTTFHLSEYQEYIRFRTYNCFTFISVKR